MKALAQQIKWQFVLLQKNNIISISLVITLIYGGVLFFLKDAGSLDKVLVALVLNDPSVIGYFFIALAVSTEIKHQVLAAVFVTPVRLHHYLISKVLALALVGLICSLGLAFFVKGMCFDIAAYAAGALGICLLSALLGLAMMAFATEFLRFTMLSIPVFLVFVNVPLLNYLANTDMGIARYILPVQGGLELIVSAVAGADGAHRGVAYVSLLLWIPFFYFLAYRSFSKKIIFRLS